MHWNKLFTISVSDRYSGPLPEQNSFSTINSRPRLQDRLAQNTFFGFADVIKSGCIVALFSCCLLCWRLIILIITFLNILLKTFQQSP